MAHPTSSTHIQVYVVVAILISIFLINLCCYEPILPPLTGMCSPKHSHTAVILDLPITLPDGSLQVADGTVYSPWAMWQQDGIQWGCQCSIKQCATRCCPEGQQVEDRSCSFSSNSFDQSVEMLEVISESEPHRIVNVSGSYFAFIEARCSSYLYSYPYMLRRDGQGYDRSWNYTHWRRDICFDFPNGYLNTRESFYCITRLPSQFEYLSNCELTKRWMHYLVLLVHLITIIVFSMLPELRTGYGNSIICYVATLFVKKAFSILLPASMSDQPKTTSLPIDTIFRNYLHTSTLLWQLLIGYKLWTAFRVTKAVASNHNQKKNIKIYSIIGWVLPFLLLILGYITMGKEFLKIEMVYLPWLLHSEPEWASKLFSTLFIQCIELARLVLGICTLRTLKSRRKEVDKFKDSESKRVNAQEIQW